MRNDSLQLEDFNDAIKKAEPEVAVEGPGMKRK